MGFKMLAHEAGQKLGQRCTVTAGSDGRIYSCGSPQQVYGGGSEGLDPGTRFRGALYDA